MICLPEIKTAELSTCRNFVKCHQAHFRFSHVGLGTSSRLLLRLILVFGNLREREPRGHSYQIARCNATLVGWLCLPSGKKYSEWQSVLAWILFPSPTLSRTHCERCSESLPKESSGKVTPISEMAIFCDEMPADQ